MKLPIKITLLLFLIIILFVAASSFYFYELINRNFQQQARQSMAQSTAFFNQRLAILRENLEREMNQISVVFFLENEDVIASIFAAPRDFNPQVISFAEKLRRRTTLDFLYVVDSDSQVVSDSLHPAAYGQTDRLADFPLDETSYVYDERACVELKKRIQFGRRVLFLRAGYFLTPRLQSASPAGIQITTREITPTETPRAPIDSDVLRALTLSDPAGKQVFEITLKASTQQLDLQKAALLKNAVAFTAVTFVICLLAGYLLSLWISHPVARLTEAAEEMSRGNLAVRVEQKGGGEIGTLIAAFNQMAADLADKQEKLLQAERIAAWKDIARHLAHEIKNPLTPIRTSLTNLRLCLEKAPEKFSEIFLESSESITEEVEKLRHLADEFSQFARLPAPSPKPANLNDVVQKAIRLYSGDSLPRIQFHPGEVPQTNFDPEQISQVVHNLVRNAIDASQPDGMIELETGKLSGQNRDWIFLNIQDHGAGMADDVRRQIFTPYFTTKEKGTGLGLSIVHRIVQEHHGEILIDSMEGKGTRIEVRLPL